MRHFIFTVVFFAGAQLAAQPGSMGENRGSRPRLIEVTGMATLSEAPDQILFNINLSGTGEGLPDAINSATEQVNSLRAHLKKNGFDENALKTASYFVNEDYEYNSGKRTLKGYKASHSLTMTIGFDKKSVELFYKALQDSEVKANLNMQFTLSQQESLKDQLLTLAIEDARKKGRTLAMAAGGELGRVLRINYGQEFGPRPYNGFNMAMDGRQVAQGAANVEFNPGNIKLSDHVRVVFEFVERKE